MNSSTSSFWRAARWSPYVVGAGIGVLSWATFYFMGKALGTSSTMVRVAAAVEGLVAPQHVQNNVYLAKHIKPIVDWQAALVVMLFFGAWLAAASGRSRRVEYVPRLWAWRFGESKALRYGAAFVGGVILIFGARLADGCTSGHCISGGLQLAVSSWVFLIAMFVTGVATAFVLFGKEGRHHV